MQPRDPPLALCGWFGAPVAGVCALMVALTILFTRYSDGDASDDQVYQYYMWFIHVEILVFVGFGFQMTFLRRYSYSAVALNYFTSALVMLEFILVGGLVQQLWDSDGGGAHVERIRLDLPLLIDAAFSAATAMITFGAVVGKVNPTQLVMLLMLEVPLYAVNQKLVGDVIKGLDMGGSLTIHAFGTYYGLAASLFLSPPGSGSDHLKNRPCYTSDMTAMVGTVFSFIFWPSYNGALAANPHLTTLPVQTQFYCVVNTVMSLLGAVVITFAVCVLLGRGKLNMFHIQNATLAGGVAMGSAANLKIQPGGALAVGTVAGLLSTAGFMFLTPFLERRMNLRDTCGVHNVHGLPGLLGALVAALASVVAYADNREVLDMIHGRRTYAFQFAAVGCTLGTAIVGGLLVGWLIHLMTPQHQVLTGSHLYEDAVLWHDVVKEEEEHGQKDTPHQQQQQLPVLRDKPISHSRARIDHPAGDGVMSEER